MKLRGKKHPLVPIKKRVIDRLLYKSELARYLLRGFLDRLGRSWYKSQSIEDAKLMILDARNLERRLKFLLKHLYRIIKEGFVL